MTEGEGTGIGTKRPTARRERGERRLGVAKRDTVFQPGWRLRVGNAPPEQLVIPRDTQGGIPDSRGGMVIDIWEPVRGLWFAIDVVWGGEAWCCFSIPGTACGLIVSFPVIVSTNISTLLLFVWCVCVVVFRGVPLGQHQTTGGVLSVLCCDGSRCHRINRNAGTVTPCEVLELHGESSLVPVSKG